MTTRTDFDQLVSDLTAAAAAYYDSDVLLMSDAAYDAGVEKVRAAVGADPSLASDDTDALLAEVAAGTSTGGEVAHPTRMLSLDKVTLPELTNTDGRAEVMAELAKFIAKVDSASGNLPGPAITAEPKIDGLALRVEYLRGRLVLAVTRGNGTMGEDVTAQVLRGEGVTGLPAQLATTWTGEVRGEVYMSTAQFEHAQTLRAERGGKPFANPRNATAGALRKVGDEHWMPMSFALYDLNDTDETGTYRDRMERAASLGFSPAMLLIPALDGDTASVIYQLETLRPTLGFEIDGAVLKANHTAARVTLGEGTRDPNWAIAVKYPPMQASSVLRDIEVGIGRTGRITLRAVIDPTLIAGSTVSYATLHHPGFIAEQGLGIGSKVLLEKRGDVIPRVQAPLDPEANEGVETWVAPETCPQCGEPWDKSSLLWRCHTPDCSVAGRLTYFLGGECLDVDGFGPAIAEAIAEAEIAKDVAGLYEMTFEQWANVPMPTKEPGVTRPLGEKTARKIVDGLEAAKQQPFNRVITSLGIRMTGRSVGRWLASEFRTMDRLRSATIADVASIERLGEVKATYIVNGLAAMSDIIDRLAAAGLNMGAEPDPATAGNLPLAGKTYVVSGSVPGYTRTTVAEKIESLGGKASSSVSKTTTALVTSETSTSKAKKAVELGIEIIDPDDFVVLLNS